MKCKLFAITTVPMVALLLLLDEFTLTATAPYPQNDIDSPFGGGGNGNGGVDYNTVMGHFKDFLMYLPVMMTTFKETMTGFPKFAEGLRILTSKNGYLDEDCKCKGNDIEDSNHLR